MRSIATNELSGDVDALVDALAHGETVLLTRDGAPIAQLAAPERPTAAERLAEVLEKHPPDPEFGDHLERTIYHIRASMEPGVREWLWDDE